MWAGSQSWQPAYPHQPRCYTHLSGYRLRPTVVSRVVGFCNHLHANSAVMTPKHFIHNVSLGYARAMPRDFGPESSSGANTSWTIILEQLKVPPPPASFATWYPNIHLITMKRLASVSASNRIAGLAGRSIRFRLSVWCRRGRLQSNRKGRVAVMNEWTGKTSDN